MSGNQAADETGSGSSSSGGVTTVRGVVELQQLLLQAASDSVDQEARGAVGGAIKRIVAELQVKDELERACSSLPPLVYDGKSDLCTLGSRPGMECVPLRSPADPYHYHHVTDQTKSLQELQNEVGALLEFRDLVIETFPDLKTKMASSTANSTLTGIPSSSLASRREWEPGIRSRRKLTYKDSASVASSAAAAAVQAAAAAAAAAGSSSAELHQHSSSSLIRSRSNSHSGKKEPKSGEGNNGSVVIQDSGFSTETSSSKETHSASSTTGGATSSGSGLGGGITIIAGQGTTTVSNTPINRLTVDTENELWNLLDVIHRKSNRLREEVDALQQLEREKCRTNQLNNNINNHTAVVSSTSNLNNNVGSSSSSSNSSNSSSSSGNLPHTHQPHQGVVPSANGSNVSLAKTFQNQLLVDIVNNKDDVQILRKERDRLFDKLSEYEAEAIASRIRTSKMQDEVDALALAKRELEDQLKAALSQKLELNSRIHDLHQQFTAGNKSAPSSPDSIKSRHPLTPGLRKHSSTDSTTSTIIATPSHLSTSPSSGSQTTIPAATHLLKPRFSQSSFAPVKGLSVSVSSSSASSSSTGAGAGSGASSKHPATVVPLAVIATAPPASDFDFDQEDAVAQRLLGHHGSTATTDELGKLDGLVSSPARLSKVRMTDSKKFAAILLESNIVELQRHLLTITVQNQVLQQRLDQATRSRIFLNKKLDKSKEDIDDLKFRLEEKTIELEGTKAQLRVLESKHQQQQQQQSASKSSSSSGFSPEHHHHPHHLPSGAVPASASASGGGSPTSSSKTAASSVVSTSAGGIVSHQHRSASTSELAQLSSPVHHHHHHHHHHQQQRELALRLAQSQVSTPSMKAMTPLAMDEILQHSSSTESAQDQAERDGRLQCPETPRRRPSKIPLAGTKGYAAPKPPTGRNFLASQQQRGEKSSPSPSGSLTNNKSLNKSTGSLNTMKSTGPSSITSKDRGGKDVSLNRPDSAQSWRQRDTSLEKSRSSSIPVSKGAGGSSPTVVKPVAAITTTMVSSSPLPKAKRDSLTTRVKNLDSLSRFQSSGASASTGNLSKSSSKKDLSSSFTTGQLRDRKQSSSAIRRVSSASVGRGSSSSSPGAAGGGEQNNNGNGSSGGGSGGGQGDTGSSGSGDNGKARRTNTFRLAKPTLTSTLEINVPPPRGRFASNIPTIVTSRTSTAPALIITSSPPTATATSRLQPRSNSSSSSSSSTGSSPSSVTTITTIESHSSSTAATTAPSDEAAPSRDLIAEYLAAKSRSQQAPAIFNSKLPPSAGPHEERQQVALAYKHPILLMDEEEDPVVYCSASSSVGKERNRDLDVQFVEDNSIELLDCKEEIGEGEQESLIVPKPKKIAFQAKASPVKSDEADGKCRLVGKVNPNILRTWEQLSGGEGSERNFGKKSGKNSLITVTSSENSAGDKQSCLIFYRNQFEDGVEAGEEAYNFRVMKIRHNRGESASEDSTTVADLEEEDGEGEESAMAMSTVAVSMATSTATTGTTATTSSEGCYDFYDSIDDSSNRMVGCRGGMGDEDEDAEEEEEYALAAGEGLADFTSLDRKKLMWSIDVE